MFLYIIAGIKLSAQLCVGTPGELEWKVWDQLPDRYIQDLKALPSYPNNPIEIKTIFKLKSPRNYTNYFGASVSGFIKVDQTTTATFNVTADDYLDFYLSSDMDPENKVLIANCPDNIAEEKHDSFPVQTSIPIVLTAGQYYYFEIDHIDGWGSDYFSVWWKTDLVDPNEWNVITAAFLYGIGCEPAPCGQAGSACDDGDATTINDIEDGNCHCYGSPTTSNSCIGERGLLTAYRYDNIAGSNINSLYEAANYPGDPAFSENLETFSIPNRNEVDNMGYELQSYLVVPVTGLYKFNVTGDDQTNLFISSDDTEVNKTATVASVTGWTNSSEHDKYPTQSTGDVYLEAGQYYYFEISEKEGGGGEHFGAFWQTPFFEPAVWKRIPAHYFFDYACEVACIPQGTLCNDGDPFTNNDMYNEFCECSGTPCSGPDCDSPLASYVPYDPCGVTDQLDNSPENNWLSCEKLPNPNPIRPPSHWILYDLNERHELYDTKIWNYNVPGETSKGISAAIFDYSLDGVTWTSLGLYNLNLANGASNYGGDVGPDFQGVYARYVLITADYPGILCKGLGKVAFTAVVCPLAGTLCDDKNLNTILDKYDNNCNCEGTLFDENDCGEDMVMLGDSVLMTNKFSAIDGVNSISHVAENSRVSFVGGKSVLLDVGFETTGQTVFQASIDPCETALRLAQEKSRAQALKEKAVQREEHKLNILTISHEEDDRILISFYLEQEGFATIEITDQMGNKEFMLTEHKYSNPGLYRKWIRKNRLQSGNYNVNFVTADVALTKNLVVVE